MNILQYFNNLWHHDNLFNNLFQNIWNLNEFLFVRNYWYWCLFISIYNLKDFFDMVDISHNLFELLHDNCFLDNSFNFSDCFIFVLYFNNFLILSNNLFDLFNNDGYFNNFLNNFFNISVNVNKLWNDSFNFNNFRNFNNYF